MNQLGNPKRRRAGALQNLAAVRATVANAPASWGRRSSAAFNERERAELVRFMESPFVEAKTPALLVFVDFEQLIHEPL